MITALYQPDNTNHGGTGQLFFFILLFIMLITGVTILLAKRKRFKICDKVPYKGYTNLKNQDKPEKKVLVEKSLYNEIIAGYNIFSHKIENLDSEAIENFRISATFTIVKKAKYKLMTPGMEQNKLLFTIEEFELIKAGLRALDLLFAEPKNKTGQSFHRSPELRLMKRVFAQLEI